MSTIVTRTGKGTPLTIAEVDANFTNLNTDKIETSTKDASGGVAGLTGFALNLKNAANTFTNFFTNTTTAARTWTFPDKDGTVALMDDVPLNITGTNTGDETPATIKTKLGIDTLSGSNTGDQDLSIFAPRLNPSITGAINLFTEVTTGITDNSTFNFEVAADTANVATSALYIYPKDTTYHRIFFGKTGRAVYALNFANVTKLESVPPFTTTDLATWGYGNFSHCIGRGNPNVAGQGFTGEGIIYNASGPVATDGQHRFFTTNAGFLGVEQGSVERLRITGAGFIGINTPAPSKTLSIGGNVSRTIWMERHTTANTAGNNLTIQAGGATSGATDKAGGQLILNGGNSTGTGASGITLQGYVPGTTGTADTAAQDMLKIVGNTLAFNNATPIAKPTVTGSIASGAALTSLLTALASLGLITNSTTA